MHQQQWLAVLEELGGYKGSLPIPNSFPQSEEDEDFSYVFLTTGLDGAGEVSGRFTEGPSLDGRGEYTVRKATPHGDEPKLAPPIPQAYAEKQEMMGSAQAPMSSSEHVHIFENIKDTLIG